MISIAPHCSLRQSVPDEYLRSLTPPPEPRRLTLPEVNVGHACTVKYLGSTASGSGNSCHLVTIRGEGTDTILQCHVKPGEWLRPSARTKQAGRCRRSSTASAPVTMPLRSSRVAAVLSSCWPTSTRAGRRPPTSSGRPRTPGVCSTHTNGLSRTLALEPDLIAAALEEAGVQIGDKGAPMSPPWETKRWNHAVSSRRFRPVLGLCVRFGHRWAFCA